MSLSILRTRPISVNDNSGYLTVIKSKKFEVSFSDKLPETKKTGDIFSKNKSERKLAKKITSKGISVDNILPAFVTLHEFRMIMAAVLEVHIDAIEIRYERYLDEHIGNQFEHVSGGYNCVTRYQQGGYNCVNVVSRIPGETRYQQGGYRTKQKIENDEIEDEDEFVVKDANSVSDVYENFVVIGIAEPIIIDIKPTTKSRFNNYDDQVMKLLTKYQLFLNKTSKITSSISMHITKMVYAMYARNLKSIDIVRLFNINETSERFPKINLHSTSLNLFKNEANSLACTVKCKDPTMRPLQGIYSSRNECTFLNNSPIDKNEAISLYNISALENGIVLFYFSIIRFDEDKSVIEKSIDKWMQANAYKILEEIHLDECVLSPSFKITDCSYIEMAHDVHIQLADEFKLSAINSLNQMPAFKAVYTTLSSVRNLGPQVHSLAAQHLLNRTFNTTASLASTTMNFYYYSLIHIINEAETNTKKNSTIIEIRNSATTETTALILAAIAMCFGSMKSVHDSSKNLRDKLASLDARMRIHQLKLVDPVLFGNKVKSDEMRDYSQLVQDNKQRPSVLTKKEYDELRADDVNSVVNIENQTTHSRLYLGCVFGEFPIINYHSEDDGTCIVKCTTAYSNGFQYQVCDLRLNGIGNEKTIENTYSSNTIVKYSSTIDIGRRCLPPKELINVFPKCHLLKLEHVWSTYKVDGVFKKVFILNRFESHYIVETEFVDEYSYVLMIKIDGFPGAFLVRNTDTNVPIIFNVETKNSFIQQLIKISKKHEENADFVNYINHIVGSKYSMKESVTDVIKKLKDEYAVKFFRNSVDYHNIVAMEFNDLLYFLPQTYNISIKIDDAIETAKHFNENRVPKISSLDITGIDRCYVDFTERKVTAVRYYGQETPVQQIDSKALLSMKGSSLTDKDIEYIDTPAWIAKYYGLIPTPESKPITHVEIIDSNLLLLKLLSIAIDNVGLDVEKIKKFLDKYSADETKLVYINHLVSWRKSKINKNVISKIDWSESNLLHLMYELERNDSNLIYDDTKEYIYERAIY